MFGRKCDKQRCGITLIELVVVMAILSILGILVFPSARSAYIRSQITQVQTDMNGIAFSLMAYFADSMGYPSTYVTAFTKEKEIDSISELTTPINYLGKIPISPWRGRRYTITRNLSGQLIEEEIKQSNYRVSTAHYYQDLLYGLYQSDHLSVWSITSGGPASPITGYHHKHWYSPTNGIFSIGGFWVDSNGVSTFHHIW